MVGSDDDDDDSDVATSSKKKKKKKQVAKKAHVKNKATDDLTLPEPTPEEIALYTSRPKKVHVKSGETPFQKEARVALEELEQFMTEPFNMDVRDIRQPKGIICSRNVYPGHVKFLVSEAHIRRSLFPVKVIYVALGNVSSLFYFCCKWSPNIYIW